MDKKKIDMVSLFCGAGGLDMGFENKGFRTVWANDFDGDACETHRAWSSAEVVQGDIGKVDFKTIPRTDVIAGGCQSWSEAGALRGINDACGKLFYEYIRIYKDRKPRISAT